MARFYGFSFEEWDVFDSQPYALAMERIQAMEALSSYTASDWPYMKKDNRDKVHRAINKTAFPNVKPRGLTFDDLANLQGMGKI